MLKLIAFTGKKTAGKSLAADYLVKKYGFVKVNFKDALIDEVIEKFPETMAILKREYKKKYVKELFGKPYPKEIRAILREYGQLARENHIDHWVREWKARSSHIQGDQIVVDDCRHYNESEAIRKKGGIIIRINRPGTDNTDPHPSEAEMDNIEPDITIENTGTKKDLYGVLDEIVG